MSDNINQSSWEIYQVFEVDTDPIDWDEWVNHSRESCHVSPSEPKHQAVDPPFFEGHHRSDGPSGILVEQAAACAGPSEASPPGGADRDW